MTPEEIAEAIIFDIPYKSADDPNIPDVPDYAWLRQRIVDAIRAERGQCAATEALDKDTAYVVDMIVRVYQVLSERGIPEALAVRIVGDWYNGFNSLVVSHFQGRIKSARTAFTHRLAREMGALDA